jgi:hypothetical protein
MINIEDIEEAIFKYMISNGRSPKYILMDVDSYEEFNNHFQPKERILNPGPIDSRIVILHSTHSILPIGILSVNVEKALLEVVG